MHWHAYHWTGPAAERSREAERRLDSAQFLDSSLPPFRSGDWLARPADQVSETFVDPEEAVDWLAAWYDTYRDRMHHPDRICQQVRVEATLGSLRMGIDCRWEEWLHEGAYMCLVMVCCPHRAANHPCPTGVPARL
ncbi:hypothetical protein OIE66_40410 [Nonomuraea sp. NBC_01738]|uniref:hypothetical protein n=1 Tax=Nonomuraea sp. NBC_01738 TaxID=2976003 RepID=UPI002E114104|nr:hypothetical protein OIE66_40410 [Nonomuraea sp. NBC_01738]